MAVHVVAAYMYVSFAFWYLTIENDVFLCLCCDSFIIFLFVQAESIAETSSADGHDLPSCTDSLIVSALCSSPVICPSLLPPHVVTLPAKQGAMFPQNCHMSETDFCSFRTPLQERETYQCEALECHLLQCLIYPLVLVLFGQYWYQKDSIVATPVLRG